MTGVKAHYMIDLRLEDILVGSEDTSLLEGKSTPNDLLKSQQVSKRSFLSSNHTLIIQISHFDSSEKKNLPVHAYKVSFHKMHRERYLRIREVCVIGHELLQITDLPLG